FKMPVAFQGLLQTEEMLGAVIAHQTLGYCLAAGFDARIAQAGELGGFAFPPQNGLDNGQPAEPGNVANDIMQLKVHLVRAFCMSSTWREALLSWLSRWRKMLRTAQTACAGRKDPRSNPTVWRYCSHWQSWTSVLRPGTPLIWRALTRQTSKPRLALRTQR